MAWLMSERNTWSLEAMLLSGMLGIAEWTAKASMRLGVATKLPKVAAASYPKERPEPIRYAAVGAMPRATPTTIGALGCDKARRSTAGNLQCRVYTLTSSGFGTTSSPEDAHARLRTRRGGPAVAGLRPARA